MKKIKFFLDPISQISPWLNKIAEKGYRLKSVRNFIYEFENSDEPYRYSSQFIGANPSRENREYISMINESGAKTFRVPINQGNITFGKLRFRPYARGSSKLSTQFNGYNKEILIVENQGDTPKPILTSMADLAKNYKDIKNAYLQAFLLMLALCIYSYYQAFIKDFSAQKIIYSIIATVVCVLIFTFLYTAHRNYKKYSKESEIRE